jgi:EAL domain-containing protein (putative c-di-GMP-specific phosphodiesterase class I)
MTLRLEAFDLLASMVAVVRPSGECLFANAKLEDTLGVKRRFDAMRAAGFALALDDFGTGFSALAYLRHFRFDRLKLDRSFIRDLADDAEARAVVASVVSLGHGLGLEVVAEGVETEAQLVELRRLGCDTVQGYLTGAPISAGELRTLVVRPALAWRWPAQEPALGAPLFDIAAVDGKGGGVGA